MPNQHLDSFVKQLRRQTVKHWDPASAFYTCVRDLQEWHRTLPADLQVSLDNLYIRSGTGEVAPLLALHCWYDHLHCTLYRISLPGFEDSLSAADLGTAPPDWVNKLRHGTYVRACSIANKFRMLLVHFPAYKVSDWHWGLFGFQTTRTMLRYLEVTYPHGRPAEVNHEASENLQGIVSVLGNMINTCPSVRPLVSSAEADLVF